MTQEIAIEIVCYGLAYLAGWLMRGGVNDHQLMDAKAKGYIECMTLTAPARKVERPKLSRVK